MAPKFYIVRRMPDERRLVVAVAYSEEGAQRLLFCARSAAAPEAIFYVMEVR